MRAVVVASIVLLALVAYGSAQGSPSSGSMSAAQSGVAPSASESSASLLLSNPGSVSSLQGPTESSSSESSQQGPQYQEPRAPPKETQDPVSTFIDDMLHGRKVNLGIFGISQGHTIAMGNKNYVYKDVAPDPAESMAKDEEDIKKGAEAGQKRNQEELGKISMEERTKKLTMSQTKIKSEERAKSFDDELKLTNEQNSKKNTEQDTKSAEQSVKQIQEADNKRKASLEAMQRAESLQKSKLNADIDLAKTKAELERKKAQEDISKVNAENDAKMSETKAKQDIESKTKNRAETQAKAEAEATQKTQQEAQSKQAKKVAEEADKRAATVNEQNEKIRKNKAEGKWCNCVTVRQYWENNNNWNLCPSGTLFAGIYRNSASQFLTAVVNYKCCRPCQEDGATVLTVSGCVDGNWGLSFDRQGWSDCPDNTFLSGFYKSSCNFIYCLEYAKCCKIDNSQGRKSCTERNWWSSLDGEGWSVLDDHNFGYGLYRTSDQWLYNIEACKQCTFYSYQKQ